jgi:hypothetical protein
MLNTTGKRLGASFGLVLALMVAVAGASWFALAQNRDASDRMVNTYLPLVFEMETLQKAHLRVSVLVRDIASHTDYQVQKQSIAALVEQGKVIDGSIESLRRKDRARERRRGRRGGDREQGQDQRGHPARARPHQDRAVRRGLDGGLQRPAADADRGLGEARQDPGGAGAPGGGTAQAVPSAAPPACAP